LFLAGDACAWGLLTHVYFAQYLLWGVVLLDPQFRRAVRKFPRLVLAGACLPDLAIVTHGSDNPFAASHDWSMVARISGSNASDADRAIFAGYASHLMVDIIAHEDFVPLHENLWLEVPVLTHAAAELAVDAHISAKVCATPGQLLTEARASLIPYVAWRFGCHGAFAEKSLGRLAAGDNLLRRAMIPQACYRLSRWLDRPSRERFGSYVRHATARLVEINRLLRGDVLSSLVRLRPAFASDRVAGVA
jgi:Zinc dependent phospholipase C